MPFHDKKAKQKEISTLVEKADSLDKLLKLEKKYFGRKDGEFTYHLKQLKTLPKIERSKEGKKLNELKKLAQRLILEKRKNLSKGESVSFDPTEPGERFYVGNTHVLTKVREDIEEYFQSIGFAVIEGPEVETDYYNFEALNMPQEHPARDLWDTFWLKPEKAKLLLRTHTSPMQVRVMEKTKPPLAAIVPGRTFRHEATDAKHEHTIDQIEGFLVDQDVKASHLKAVLFGLFRHLFGEKVEVELRPSYFPFTEPSYELFMKSPKKIAGSHWLEMLGSGMIHPRVFEAVGYPKGKYSGFAFGLGLGRVAMLKYGIPDIRMLYQNDIRVLRQF